MRLHTRWLTLGIASLACVMAAGLGAAASRVTLTTPVLMASANPDRHVAATVPAPKTLRLKPVPAPLASLPGALADPPPNDQCSGAITIPCGNISLSGNTFMAVNDYDFPDTTLSCTGYSASGRDVVYRFDAMAGDSVWLRYSSSADAAIYIVTDCGQVTTSCKIGVDENRQGTSETLRYGFPTTGTYYVVLDSYGQDSYGNWTLVGQFFSCGLFPPVNDRCETATGLYCGGFLYTGNTVTAQDDYSFPSIGSSCVSSRSQGRDVVFSLQVNAGDSLSVSYTSTADAILYLMPDCPKSGTPVNCLIGANATGPGGTETIHYSFAFTGSYYLVLDSDNLNTDGGWTLVGSLTCGLNVPTNDQCASAVYLPCGPFQLSGDNTLAFPDYDPTEAGCTGFSAQGADLVYRIDASPGDSIWCDYVFPHVNGKDDVDASIYLVTKCDSVAMTCVAGSDTTGAAQMERFRYKFTTRGIYYMILDSYTPGISGVWTALGEIICPQILGVGGRPLGDAMSLSAAVPNPFRQSSTLRFTLPGRAHATLRIHDLAGRLVRSLVDADLPAGAQATSWDARDDRGVHVAGGTYFARLMVGDKLAYRTMILVR